MEDTGISVLCPEMYLCVCEEKRIPLEAKDTTRIEGKMLLRRIRKLAGKWAVDHPGSDSELGLLFTKFRNMFPRIKYQV
jgi:hypothetical protein